MLDNPLRRTRNRRRDNKSNSLFCFEKLEDRKLLAGVTLITHGQTLGNDYPEWVDYMAMEVGRQVEQETGGSWAWYQIEIQDTWPTVNHIRLEEDYLDFGFDLQHANNASSGEIVLTLDWSNYAGTFAPNELIIGHIKKFLTTTYSGIGISQPLVELPLHLIGHSRGASLVGGLAESLGHEGIWVDQVTFLDTHPLPNDWGRPFPFFHDLYVPENVIFADSFWRWDLFEPLDFNGHEVPGAYNQRLVENVLNGTAFNNPGYSLIGGSHADVHLWYHGTILPFDNQNQLRPIDDGDETVSLEELDEFGWYSQSKGMPGPRELSGYTNSRLGGNSFYHRPVEGIAEETFLGMGPGGTWLGVGERRAVSPGEPENQQANIGYFLSIDDRVEPGEAVGLRYFFDTPNENATGSFEFYLDQDQNPYNGYEAQLGSSEQLASQSMSSKDFWGVVPTGTAANDYFVFGVARHNQFDRYFYADWKVTVQDEQFQITTYSGANGSVEATQNVPLGGSWTIDATPNPGFVVNEWFYNDPNTPAQFGGNSLTINNVNSDGWVNVFFKPAPVAPAISITNPVGGVYGTGTKLNILWNSQELTGRIRIELLNGNNLVDEINASFPVSYGKIAYTLPNNLQSGSAYRVRLTSLDVTSVVAVSSPFTVLKINVNQGPIPVDTMQELQWVGSDQLVDVATNTLCTNPTSPNCYEFARNGSYVLTADLDGRSFDFVPLAQGQNIFRGVFDGQNHKIVDFRIDVIAAGTNRVGLFSQIDTDGVVKNLILEDGYVWSGADYTGAVAGENKGLIQNVHSSVEVRGKGADSDVLGGLVGENLGIIRNSSTTDAPGNSGQMLAEDDTVGGIAGINETNGIIEWSYSDVSSVRTRDSEVGGIAGVNKGLIRQSYAAMMTRVEGNHAVGGIAGDNSGGSIYDSFVITKVDSNNTAGGLVGKGGGLVVNSYAVPILVGSVRGGLFGVHNGSVVASFWDVTVSGENDLFGSGSGSVDAFSRGMSTADMQMASNYTSAGWNFDDVWYFVPGQYPQLRGARPTITDSIVVNASDGLDGVVNLEWNSIINANTYFVHRSDSEQSVPQMVGTTSDLSFVDSTTLPGLPYYYYVTAAYTSEGAGLSELKNAIPDIGFSIVRPDPPQNAQASTAIAEKIVVNWDGSSGASHYQVYRSETFSGSRAPISAWIAATNFVDVNTEAGQEYFYWVTAATDDQGTGQSEFSNYAIGTEGIGMIRLSQHEIDFGWVFKGNTAFKEFTIFNDGYAPLVIQQIADFNSPFFVIDENGPEISDDWVISPGSSREVTIGFHANELDDYSGDLTIISSDFNQPTIHLELIGTTTIQATGVGLITWTEWVGVNNLGERWYSGVAKRDGFITVEAVFAHAQGDIDLQGFDSDLNLLSSSHGFGDSERVETYAQQGETYYLRVLGDNPTINFTATNLVWIDGENRIWINGTANSDQYEFDFGPTNAVTVNGTTYQFAATDFDTYRIHGGGGEDSVIVRGAADDMVAILGPTWARVESGELLLDGFSAESFQVVGGSGNNVAYVRDSIGNDMFAAAPFQVSMTGTGYDISVIGFKKTVGYGTAGGNDVAAFVDSPENDIYYAEPAFALMRAEGEFPAYENIVDGFFLSTGTFHAGGFIDTANFVDSSGDDFFIVSPEMARMSGSGFHHEATGFNRTHGLSDNGGFDQATLIDSAGDDIFYASPVVAQIVGSENTFEIYAWRFSETLTQAINGGFDVATYTDSAGDDQFTATPTWAQMIGTGFNNRSEGFQKTRAYALRSESGDRGYDRAFLFDSALDDTFSVYGENTMNRLDGTMTNGIYTNLVDAFEEVTIDGSAGGINTLDAVKAEREYMLNFDPEQWT